MSILRRISNLCINLRQYSSALYITGDKASSNFVVLVPHIDFEERIENRVELEENIKLRQKRINLDKYLKYWEFYKHLHEKMLMLNGTKRVINEYIVELKKEPEKNKEEIEKLQLHAKEAKDNYKNLRDYIYPVEEMAVLNVLSIPNVLDKRTPHTNHCILYNYLEKPVQKARNHFELAVDSNLLYYLNPTFSVLENDAAFFEHSLINYFYDILLINNYVPTVNTSFTRSVIIEGCCVDYLDPKQVFTVYEEDSKYSVSKVHFVGNANLFSFMAYFAKFSVQPNYLPLKFFTSGKQYYPLSKKNPPKSLLELNQYSTIDIFSITKNNEQDTENCFQDVIKIVKQMYDSLGYHYRLVYLPANELKDYETLRVAIQMFSSHLQTYVEVGNISLCGDYLSKRLLVTYNEDKTRKYSNIIHGTLVNVQKVLACVLEYNDLSKKKLLSDLLKKYSLL
ncbi:seryl-trna synthetase [Holotrichia oblita]|uniref:Seryl-trna synthetase n=1 Tax=Holotrichia oblita TaxID=644536 RepID=A0ACB9T7L0_HOLOL|nr:seryl-trna synthetase [Holotrichia oblita]